jgi:hypothetical protein
LKRLTRFINSYPKLTKVKGEKVQINRFRVEKGDIATDTTLIQRIIRD